jgi:hypothetical protein
MAHALLLPLLSSFGPALLNKLFGGDPQKVYRQRVAQLTSPGNVAGLTNQFYQQLLGSPMFSQAQAGIAGGANQASNDVASSLAQRGIGTSGSASILSGLTPSLIGSQMGQLRAGTYGQAQGQAQNSIQSQLGALGQTYGPSQTAQFAGAGINAFAPFLQAFLKSKYPNMFGSMTGGAGAGTGSSMGGGNVNDILQLLMSRQ